jgi:hypothetical protein
LQRVEKLKRTIFSLALLLLCGIAQGAPVLLTFTELPQQAVNGITVSGVHFSFDVGGTPSTEALYNGELPVSTTYLDDRVLTGRADGTLTLDFSHTTSTLAFGIVLNTLDLMQPGIFVELFDSGLQSIGTSTLDTNPLILFSEGQFSYAGTPISRAVITFNTSSGADLFALDNLEFEASEVPEPSTLSLIAIAAVFAIGRARRA